MHTGSSVRQTAMGGIPPPPPSTSSRIVLDHAYKQWCLTDSNGGSTPPQNLAELFWTMHTSTEVVGTLNMM